MKLKKQNFKKSAKDKIRNIKKKDRNEKPNI